MKTKSASEVTTAVKGLVARFPNAEYQKAGKGGCGNVSGNVIVDGETVMTGCVVGCAVKQCEGTESEAYEWMVDNDNYPAGELLRGIGLGIIDDNDLVWLCAMQEAQDGGYAWQAASDKADGELKRFHALSERGQAEYLVHL
jgi:hypothetical protein